MEKIKCITFDKAAQDAELKADSEKQFQALKNFQLKIKNLNPKNKPKLIEVAGVKFDEDKLMKNPKNKPQ